MRSIRRDVHAHVPHTPPLLAGRGHCVLAHVPEAQHALSLRERAHGPRRCAAHVPCVPKGTSESGVRGDAHAKRQTDAYSAWRVLLQLRSLDLGGNPCSRAAEGYKFQVVRVLPRLKTLDGDQITQLDKDLSEDFAVHGRSGASSRKQTSSAARSDLRPFTAPASSAADRLRPMRWDAPTPKGTSGTHSNAEMRRKALTAWPCSCLLR